MSKMEYRTYLNTKPRGKQKVFFISHPEDFSLYFDEIATMILEAQKNAAIWYSPKCAEVELDDLDDMQLMVIPISSRFLHTSNEAKDKVFIYAQKKHIPILPILMEDCLADDFNKIYGNIQAVSYAQGDSSELSYEEKVNRFLEDVLVGDELAERIRDAFDAYIFMGYRRMDRKYALELMRLIHQNPICWDIAIWYDEFLTPGGNFDEEIEEALEQSEIYALTVTPNLKNSSYIASTEYPNAKNKGKLILPVEMNETDISELKDVFTDLPEVISKNDIASLNASLLAAFGETATNENTADAEHKYYIGLAYLNGIDVEIDTERAVCLITAAAEAGVTEACEKLYQMYQIGVGVERNANKALEWEIKYVERLENEYLTSLSPKILSKIFYEIRKLVDELNALNQPELEKYYAMKMLLIANEMQEQNIKYAKRNISISCNKLGKICHNRNQYEDAEEYYKKALKISEELVKQTNSVEARHDLSVSYNYLGKYNSDIGDLEEAKEYYEKGLCISEKLAEETKAIKERRNLGFSYCYLGKLLMDMKATEEAVIYYQKGLDVRLELVKETARADVMRDLSFSYYFLGDISKSLNNFEEAEAYYLKSLEIREKLAEETGTATALRDLKIIYYYLQIICRILKKQDEEKEYASISKKIAEELGEE